jgi:multisubunit Na+/H+ antiporter MnhE subunit
VSVLVGYSNPQDLVEKQRAPGESSAELISALKEIDFPEITAKFPCIKVGDASPVELYEDSTNMKFKEAALSEKLTNFIQGSARNLESAYEFHNDCHPLNQTPTTAGDLSISEEIPLIEPIVDKKSPESLSDAITSDNSILDKSIRCLPGTTSRQYRQLEDGGFHTVSAVKLLLSYFSFDLVKTGKKLTSSSFIGPQIIAAFSSDLCRSAKPSRPHRIWAVYYVIWYCYIFQVIKHYALEI